MTAILQEPSSGGGGGSTDDAYVHTQAVAATVWTVAHGLGKRANVTLVDTLAREFYGQIDYIDDDNLTVTLAIAASGSAYLS